MKKILISIVMGMMCSPLAAENLKKMATEMGYTEAHLFEHLPEVRQVRRAIPRTIVESADLSDQRLKPALNPDDFLHLRVFAEPEPSGMIPLLMKLQKQNPTSAKITRKLAVTCLKSGQPREALYWYIQTYQRDRSDYESLWNMAALAYQLGDDEQTVKYLKEYAIVDPNSAWGRLARDFLKGRYNGETMNDAFKREISRFGVMGNDASDKTAKGVPRVHDGEAGSDGILVIEGKRTSVERFVESYDSKPVEKPVKLEDAVKGKSGKSKEKVARKAKGSIAKAKIVKPAEKDFSEVTTVAEPLGAVGKP
ncbi:MAG: hypothetical protein Kow0029_13190 [Candidatus Rifleibacteriota bacterium]